MMMMIYISNDSQYKWLYLWYPKWGASKQYTILLMGGLMLIQMGKWEKSIFISFPLYDLNWNDTKKREEKGIFGLR